MRFVVFGGAGDMGRRAARELAVTPGVERVTLADRNRAAAEAVRDRLAADPAVRCRIEAVAVDALDTGAAAALMRQHDVAVGAAGPFYRMHIFSGRVTTYAAGRWQEVPAGSEPERVAFPAPLGTVTVFHVGHPEPVTLPRFLPGLREVRLKGGLTEPLLNRLAVLFGRLGITASHRRRQRLAAVLKPLLPLLERLGPPPVPASGLTVRVRGTRERRPVEWTYAATGPMAALTAVPLALGALWLAQGRAGAPGVLAPEAEGGPEPEAFFRQLERRGVRVQRPAG